MAARDIFHELVKKALINEGWNITHDPFKIMMGRRRGYIDLGAEKEIIAAQKDNEKIAVEIKSFIGHSDIDDFEDALGQFLIYWKALKNTDSERILYLDCSQWFLSKIL